MDNDAGMIPSSPSAESSSSSSDIDTESTCSFFRDRSTTLGTLMGVSLADGEDRPPETQQAAGEQERPREPAPGEEGWTWRRRWRPRRGASWWRLCRDDVGGTTSLAHFLHMERQLSGDGGEVTVPLFENGRVLPSSSATAAAVVEDQRAKWKLRRSAQGSLSLARLPVLLTGICSGGA
ncbi:hypothetical protein CFC21_093570 [Triticum aestivum]|uniref:Uncharacterized protein n=4 Tax=Triticinae TaxID=1648030 RepID=A0A453PIB6_AEGTS|nr:uncharacterized protein At3g17950 [Aegilops tauschii subsp. strangulata]XP_044420753.1 uncharacterized protein At3g17950-like [Triticum aestivum]KAF7090891.1 hypothetical protein CFC21_093570 [Triticum aestivum]